MFRTTIPTIVVLLTLCSTGHPAEARQPNIVLILADDLGYETLGCNGGESYKTPNLDRLAANGMRCERCYVQPLCSPTRIQLMTGIYNVRNYKDWAVIDPNTITFATLLKRAGYATAIAGKWQLGTQKDLPQKLGFGEACLWLHTRRPPRYANPGLEYNGEERDFNNGEYGPDVVSDFALDFIDKHKSKPFLLYYTMMLVHKPFQPTPDSHDWDPKAKSEKGVDDVKHFPDMVAYMDKLVGKLIAKLDEAGVGDNTLILFVGDNGTAHGVVSKFRGGKYEGGKGMSNDRGMHVPLIANWPGHIRKGGVNGDLVDSTDFLPTLCEAAGVKVPASLAIDGHSFYPQIMGSKASPREWIYSWFSMHGGPRGREFAMDKTHKLYRNGRFVDLAADPLEERPMRVETVTGEKAAAASKLKDVLAHYSNARPAEMMAKTPVEKPAKKNAEKKAARRARKAAQQKTGE
jgi:arylsulfatase A